MIVIAPCDDRAVRFQCQAVISAGFNRSHIIEPGRNIDLAAVILSPSHHGAIGFECQ